MADTNLTDTDVDTTNTGNDTEPATKHDVGIGGGLGAVGGAVVGALAGGPLGAVIGAVVGGAASAGAVDVVDKHDHDYARTEGGANAADTGASLSPTSTVSSDAYAGNATEYTGAGDYQRTGVLADDAALDSELAEEDIAGDATVTRTSSPLL